MGVPIDIAALFAAKEIPIETGAIVFSMPIKSTSGVLAAALALHVASTGAVRAEGAVHVEAPVRVEAAVVLGDSIGLGLATTIGLKSIARRSFSLRRGDVGGQLKQIPENAVGLMSLGLNDAADPVAHLSKSIDRVIESATSAGKKLIWIGPPCETKSWDKRAEELDAYLKERLAQTTIQYVSLRDANICAPALRTRDGEHFTVEGYRYVWAKIKRDAPLAAPLEPDVCERQKAEAAYRGRKAPPVCAKSAS